MRRATIVCHSRSSRGRSKPRCCHLPLVILVLLGIVGCRTTQHGGQSRNAPDSRPTAAQRMIRASEERLAPVYEPLAEYIVQQFQLAEADGIGIDLGSGPGTLIVALAQRTRLHWVNADINPHFFAYFHQLAERNNLTGRVSAILADAQDLPFRGDYADIIVSRGSYPFWADKQKAFGEVHRVLKPGGVAFIGRGFSPNLSIETAIQIRNAQGASMKYPFDEKAAELHAIMRNLGIADYRIHNPSIQHGDKVNYGIWIEFHKPSGERRQP